MSDKNTLEFLKNLLNTSFMVDRSSVMPARSLESLGLDSLDEIELVMAIEEEFSISINDEDFTKSTPTTIENLICLIEAKRP